MRMYRNFALGAAVLAVATVAAACSSGGGENTGASPSGSPKGTITVGVSGSFAENQLVAEMYAQVLEKAGYTVNRKLDLQTRQISDPALFNGDIDLKPEYLAYELPALDPNADTSGTADQVLARLKPLAEAKHIEVLQYTPANDTNVLVVTKDTATKYSLTTISDLAPVADKLVLGGPSACPKNTFCIPALKKIYGITFKDFKALDEGGPATVAAVENGVVDVGLMFSTDPTIAAKGFVTLQDDKNSQPAGNIAPMIRDDANNSEIEDLLNSVSLRITTENITAAIKEVTVDKKDVADVATAFLQTNGLL
jgi:osmoprotectant transport system substrate-binding protein